MTRDEVAKALMELPKDDAVEIGVSLVKGMLMRAAEDHQLAPMIAGLLDLEGILIVTADARGPILESTSHDDARALCKMLIKSLHKLVAEEIDTVCKPARAEDHPNDEPLTCCPRASWGDGDHDIGCRRGGSIY